MGKVGAPYGNRNAEKWTFRKSVKLFHDAIDLTNQKDEKGYKFDFIGEIARELGTYKDIFNQLLNRFPILKRLKNQIDTNIEQNCYYNGKKGIIKEASAIMNLKSNWKWTDRNEVRQEITETNQPDLSKLTYKELLELKRENK